MFTMRTLANTATLLTLACGAGCKGSTPPHEPTWVTERARDLEPAAYAAAVDALVRASPPGGELTVKADAMCGGDQLHASYRMVADTLELDVTAANALATSPVELRLGGKVAFHKSGGERANSIPEGAPAMAPFVVEHASETLTDGVDVPAQFTVAVAHGDGGVMFTWGKPRTIKGPTVRLQRPDAAALARFAAERALTVRFLAEESLLSEDDGRFYGLVREARRWNTASARAVVAAYDRLRADRDRRLAATTWEFDHDGPGAARILALSGAACR